MKYLVLSICRKGNMLANIIKELKEHIPFTIFGALTGIVVMFLFYRVPDNIAYNIFYNGHPELSLV